MGLFNKKKNSRVEFIEGLDRFNKGAIITLSLDEENQCLVMEHLNKNIGKVYLKYDQIIIAKCILEKEIIQMNKSVIGRAAAGGILLGGLGAIVGAVSGTGTKKKNKFKNFLIINYKDNQGEVKALSFDVTNSNFYICDIVKKLNENANLKEDIYL